SLSRRDIDLIHIFNFYFFFFLFVRLTPRSTLFPYTTLFRSFVERAPVFAVCFVFAAPAFHASFAAFGPPVKNAFAERPKVSAPRSEEHTSELQSRSDLVCRLLLEKKNITT